MVDKKQASLQEHGKKTPWNNFTKLNNYVYYKDCTVQFDF